ncbi:MAG: 7,8-dihydropterin-6-yl-methyl-4-(beta-D-ribofuranosyl)aminobenzene 5-phosphate synthase [Candidatus Atribacteria bacterium]|nr:7,8-dihydropterin-6-yl-methyl-4-(beta-D-ribofuranosyl)aminobenzene 5-phosphate synthase [Candidatus Atribacteria bacterium]
MIKRKRGIFTGWSLAKVLTIATLGLLGPGEGMEESVLLAEENGREEKPIEIKITVIYDNYPLVEGLKTEWGFSCLIKGLEKTILFDTGGRGDLLLENMKKLNINPQGIDIVFISHDHWDHTGGLATFLQENSEVEVFLLDSFSSALKDEVTRRGADLREVKGPTAVCSRVYSTGTLGTAIKEQSLVIEAEQGLVVITGCAHPGVVNIIRSVKARYHQDIYLVMGGFHLLDLPLGELQKVAKQLRGLGVKMVGPSHCSGDLCREWFAQEYGQDLVEIGVGKTISFPLKLKP